MVKIRRMEVSDVEEVAELVALDHDTNREKGYREAKEHTLDHLETVPNHCFVVETADHQIIAAMILHPQDKIFEIEDFHIRRIQENKQALRLLKNMLLKQLETVQTEVLCCPYALRRLITIN